MKGKVTKALQLGIVRTAAISGTFQGKTIELGVTNTNTTWETIFGNKQPKVGEEIEIDDNMIQVAVNPGTNTPTGRHFISRVSFDKEAQVLKGLQNKQALKAMSV